MRVLNKTHLGYDFKAQEAFLNASARDSPCSW